MNLAPAESDSGSLAVLPKASGKFTELNWSFRGLIPYVEGIALQESLRERVANGGPDYLLMVEHPPTITLGRRTEDESLLWTRHELAENGIEVVHTSRGGQATYHGPGQLVAYPIVNLRSRGLGVKWYVCMLEEVILNTCAKYGISAQRQPGAPGIYLGPEKIAALGIRVQRGVTTHGIALNVVTDLQPFSYIVPCGSPGMAATSIANASKNGDNAGKLDVSSVAMVFMEEFARVFRMDASEDKEYGIVRGEI